MPIQSWCGDRRGDNLWLCHLDGGLAPPVGSTRKGKHWTAFEMSPGLDLAAGAVSGIASALVGQPGPPVLIYLLLAGTAAKTVRATLLAFFALSYAVTLASHAATIGISAPTWFAAGILLPFAFLGGFAGRPIGDRLGAEAFAVLAIALRAGAGAYTLGAAALAFVGASLPAHSSRVRH
jgi:uncharacterized membrane protein YfcA